jgi:hypothetical protein
VSPDIVVSAGRRPAVHIAWQGRWQGACRFPLLPAGFEFSNHLRNHADVLDYLSLDPQPQIIQELAHLFPSISSICGAPSRVATARVSSSPPRFSLLQRLAYQYPLKVMGDERRDYRENLL